MLMLLNYLFSIFARLGSVSTNLISPGLAEDVSLEFACWFGVILCAMSVVCVIVTIPIDR
jgi:Zn-dependent membrane protease YugP